MQLLSRERVYASINHREPDRVPICFGGTPATGIEECPPDYRAATNLYNHLKLTDTAPVKLYPVCNLVTNIDNRCISRLHSDILLVSDNPPGPVDIDHEHKMWPHFYGCRIKKCGIYDQIDFTNSPMAYMNTIKDIEEYPYWPVDNVDIMHGVAEHAEQLHEDTDYFICGALSTGHFPLNGYSLLSGMDKWLMDMKLNPEFYHRLCEKFMEYSFQQIDAFYGGVGKYIDAAIVYDDLGSQAGPFMSLSDYRQYYKYYQAETIKRIKKHLQAKAKIILKCGGSISQFIPDFIDIGVDVLSPVQPLARNMDPWRLKKEFGKDIAFLGGFDIQNLLPFGKTEDIRRGVRLLFDEYAHRGGYIFSAGYVIQCNTPPENIVTMFDAAYEYGSYPLAERKEDTTYVDFIRGLRL